MPAIMCAAVVVLPAPTAGADDANHAEQRRSAAGPPAAMPRSPVAAGDGSAASSPKGDGIELRGRRLLAGLPGQSLSVRVRLDDRSRARAGDSLEVTLRRIRRPDPRHPGNPIGGETLARTVVPIGGERARLRFRGLNPAPGPHRVVAVTAGGERLAAARLDVLVQEHRANARRSAAQARAAQSRPRSAAPRSATPRSLPVAAVDHDLSFGSGSEASSAIALDPANPERAIAAANDSGSPPLAFVSDAGLSSGSVARRTLPSAVRLPGSGGASTELAICCDPAVAATAGGELWMAAAGAASGGGRIVLGRVPAGGSAFATSATGLPTVAGSSAQSKPALAAAGGDRLAAVWVETLGGLQNVVFSQCSLASGAAACDDPDAWTAPAAVTAGGGLYTMPDVAFAPNGDLYVVWWNPGAANAVQIDRCRAGEGCGQAASWDEDATVANLDAFDDDGDGDLDPLPLFCPIIAAPGGLVNPSPSVEVGGDGTVHVAYSDLRDNAGPANPSRCTASGSDRSFDSLVASGPAPDTPPAPDSGVRISADAALALNDHFLPALSVDPSSGLLEASFYSTDGDPGGQRTSRDYVASSDGGQSFSAPVTFSDAASRFAGPLSDGVDYGDRQGADSAAGVFRPTWTDNRALQSRDPDLYTLSAEVETTIAAGPAGTVPDAISSFTFSTPAVRTECRLDASATVSCPSPFTVGPLPNGAHSLDVRATDAAGNPMDRSPATASWTVADATPPETTITRGPRASTRRKRPRFEFVSTELGARFQCRYDAARWTACRTPKRAKVKVGRHTFRVRALDLARNVDPTPEVARFTRKPKR